MSLKAAFWKTLEQHHISQHIQEEGPPKTTTPTAMVNSQTISSTSAASSPQVSDYCTLAKNEHGSSIKAHAGGSVMLPCYCTDLHKKPETFTWQKLNTTRNTWEEISSESGQYRDRVQLVNGHSPGNLSLLISHLTEEDRGVYRCDIRADKHIDIRLTVEGCTLVNHEKVLSITAHTGGSVLLPCYCTDLHTKPERFIWKKDNKQTKRREVISSGSGQYRDRVQLVNGHSPGNLSLLISHLTEEDGGDYRCHDSGAQHIDIRLTIQDCTLVKNGNETFIKAHTGGSALLPCYCTDLHTTPKRFTWKKYNSTRNTWEEISSGSGQYRDRVQLVNGHSPGNLSLLISHLTEEDGGVYRCEAEGIELIDIRLAVEEGPPKTTTPTAMVNSQTISSTSAASSPQVSDYCTLAKNEHGSSIKAHAGGSVMLPCYCTDLHKKPETFTWQKLNTTRNTWEEISSESGQYRDRVQLVNGHSPGNLSLLISHLTEEDGGVYRCDIRADKHIDIRLTVEGCTLVNHEKVLSITAHTGGSVLLPCYCTDLHTKPERFSWKKDNKQTKRREVISSGSGQYRDRVQLVNGHSPGNLSLLISHLIKEDGGNYFCAVKGSHRNIKLTLQEHKTTPKTTASPAVVKTQTISNSSPMADVNSSTLTAVDVQMSLLSFIFVVLFYVL
ncbi:hypothetical protein SRHO_G00074510 [Serrasalmus rhombeus]